MANKVEVIYDDKTLETLITVNGKSFDTSRINGKEIADWAYPFMMRKVRWNGFYDEMVQALGGQKAFNLVFEGSDEALAELREAWENAPVNIVSGGGTENVVVIVYDENALTTEITVNGQSFDTSRINGKEIADWVYPFMMRKVKWDGIFEELAKVVGSQEYTIQFSGSNAAMNELMEECPETVSIQKNKGNASPNSDNVNNFEKEERVVKEILRKKEYNVPEDYDDFEDMLWSVGYDLDDEEKISLYTNLISELSSTKKLNDCAVVHYAIAVCTESMGNLGASVDYHEILKHFLKASEKGYKPATFEAAALYRSGEDVPKDISKAIELYKSIHADSELEELYSEIGDRNDYTNSSITKGCSDTGASSGNDFEAEERDVKKILRKKEYSIIEDDDDIQGMILSVGHEIDDEDNRHTLLMRLIKELSDADLYKLHDSAVYHYAIAECMSSFYDFDEHEKYVDHYYKASQKGYVPAIIQMAECYEYGAGVKEDITKAIELYKKIDWYWHTGQCYIKLGDYSLSYDYYAKALNNGSNITNTNGELTIETEKSIIRFDNALNNLATECDNQNQYSISLKCRMKLAKYGDAIAIANLGWHYHYGKGVEKNLEQAVRYYKKAIAVGDTWSKDKLKELCIDPDTPFYEPELSDDMKAILDFFNNEEYVIADQNELDDVIDKLSKYAKQGNPTAQFTLGKCYLEGIGVEESLQKARVWISKAAENGHPTALSAMAEAYHYGEDIQADDRKAFQYIRKAVDCGADPDDMDLLAAFYTYGWGTPVNVSQGLECRKVAAEFGSANAQLMMGLSYEEGDGVQKDESKAFEYYKLAADQYDKNGLNKVATCYAFGIGVQQDLKQAAYYAESAMDHGSVSGACLLADMYMNGEGVQKDTAYGLSLYKQAHEIDPEDGSPLYSLGICFYFGLGVAKNEAQGMDYITQAANLDDENALEFLQEIENEKDAIRRYEQRNGAVDDLLDLAGLIPGVSEFTSAIKIGKKTGEKIAGGFFKFFGN